MICRKAIVSVLSANSKYPCWGYAGRSASRLTRRIVCEVRFKELAGARLEPAASCVTGRRSNQLNYAPAWDKVLTLLLCLLMSPGSLSCPPVPCRSIWWCRDRATTTCNLLDFNATDSPFLIL